MFGGKFWECVTRRFLYSGSGERFWLFAAFCREPGEGDLSECAVGGSGGKRREIATKMGFCVDMTGYASCGSGSRA